MALDKAGKAFWEEKWGNSALIYFQGIDKYLAVNKKFNSLFKKFLKKDENTKILEIGCAGGKKLIYFAKEFNYKIHGVDYSEEGIKTALENLELADVSGNLICEDIFRSNLNKEYFDVVYSMGLIEHFENPEDIIDIHIQLLKNRGILILTMPNFRYNLYFCIRKMLGMDKELLNNHNLELMDKEKFKEILIHKNLKFLYLDYFGPIDFSLVFGDMHPNKILLLIIHFLNQCIGYLTFYMPSSRYFSPYIVLIAEKSFKND